MCERDPSDDVLRPPPLALRLGLPGPKHETFRLDDDRRRCNVEATIEPQLIQEHAFLEKLGQLERDSNRLSDLPRLRSSTRALRGGNWKRRRIHEQVPTKESTSVNPGLWERAAEYLRNLSISRGHAGSGDKNFSNTSKRRICPLSVRHAPVPRLKISTSSPGNTGRSCNST